MFREGFGPGCVPTSPRENPHARQDTGTKGKKPGQHDGGEPPCARTSVGTEVPLRRKRAGVLPARHAPLSSECQPLPIAPLGRTGVFTQLWFADLCGNLLRTAVSSWLPGAGRPFPHHDGPCLRRTLKLPAWPKGIVFMALMPPPRGLSSRWTPFLNASPHFRTLLSAAVLPTGHLHGPGIGRVPHRLSWGRRPPDVPLLFSPSRLNV